MDDLARRHRDLPLDDGLAAAVATSGLQARLVDLEDHDAFAAWFAAKSRGFLGPEPTSDHVAAGASFARGLRMTAVHDVGAAAPEAPVATSASWTAELTVPGGRLPVCAISGVTVAPTHRRRGLLRALMGGELRTATEAGFAVAALTVSESAIYGRFGFAPAALAADVSIDARRAGWTGPTPDGRLDLVTREQGRAEAQRLHDRCRAGTPGEVDRVPAAWDAQFGLVPGAERPGALRVVRYTSTAGEVDGQAVYVVHPNEDDYPASTVRLHRLDAATDDAYAALWHYLLSLDLVATVRVGELSVDEPLWWMLADRRAATVTVRDHHYVRVLDVRAALSSRRYAHPDTLVLDVTDPAGLGDGRHLLRVADDGTADVSTTDEIPEGACTVQLGIAELSALLVGGTSAVTLARAGRLRTDDAARVTRLFAWHVPPRLTHWY